jgi:4-carboxymuconolactone decarboxylase
MARIEPAELPDDLPVHNNLVRATFRNPDMHRGFASLSGRVHSASNLPGRTRELVVLRVANIVGAAYELQQHEMAAAHQGVTSDEISALRAGEVSGFDAAEKAAVDLAAAVETGDVDDALWLSASKHYSEVELLDIVMLAGFYGLASRFVVALDVDLEG